MTERKHIKVEYSQAVKQNSIQSCKTLGPADTLNRLAYQLLSENGFRDGYFIRDHVRRWHVVRPNIVTSQARVLSITSRGSKLTVQS